MVNQSGIIEGLNVCTVITEFTDNPSFDTEFRKIFTDERIDYASSVTFVKPKRNGDAFGMGNSDKLVYKQNEKGKLWTDTYWGRLISWDGKFNQIERSIERLKEHKNSKTISMSVYAPHKDGKKTQAGIPCLLSIDLKPRNGELHLTAFFRSQAVSKSGYADYHALVKMGKFLAEESDMKLKTVTNFACSSHLRTQNNELKNSKLLLERVT